VRNNLLSSKTVLSFTWSEGATNGGSAVIDYSVWYDQSISVFIQAATGLTSKSFTTTYLQSILQGNQYTFYVKARNAVGFSLSSVNIVMLAAIVPGAPTAVTTYNNGVQVYLKWTPPSATPLTDYGDTIRGYQVYI
jgi:hypothetical protein